MTALAHTIMLWSGPAAGALVSAIFAGLVLAACVALCLRCMPGMTAAARSVVWTAVLLLLVLLPFAPFSGTGLPPSVPAKESLFHAGLCWSFAVVCLWATLSLMRGAQFILGMMRLHQVASRATPVPCHADCALLLRSVYRTATLCTSPDVDRPCVAGFFSPAILLPPTLFEKLSPSDLQQIVLHEMEHLHRLDDWTNFLQKLSLAFFPLNPVLLWVERRLCMERELACDDRVLRTTRARKTYAACLVRLAEHSLTRQSMLLALGAWERQSEVARRVHRILRRPDAAMGKTQVCAATSIMVLSLLGGATLLAHGPRLVGFTPATYSTAQATTQPGYQSSSPAGAFREISPRLRNVDAAMPAQRPVEARLIAATYRDHSRDHSRNPFPSHSRRRAAAQCQTEVRTSQTRTLPARTSWLVLTAWQQVPPLSKLVTPALYKKILPPYAAAIPWANGWLIVQL